MRSTAAYADQRMGKPSNIKGGSLGNGRAIVFQTNYRELLRMAETSVSGKVSIDVSEALTGLKAVQREAKETVKVLRELESVNQKYVLTSEERNRFEKTPREGLGTVGFVQYEPPAFKILIESFSRAELVNELKRRGPREKIYHQFLPEGETLHINTKQEPSTYNALSEVLIIVD